MYSSFRGMVRCVHRQDVYQSLRCRHWSHRTPSACTPGTELTNGRVINDVRLPMISRICWSLMIQLINPNQIRHRTSGYRHEKIIGASMVDAGSASRRNIGCGIAARSLKLWVCWLRLASDKSKEWHAKPNKYFLLELLSSGISFWLCHR